MGDLGNVGSFCERLHPNYHTVTITFIIPKDLTVKEVHKALVECLNRYVRENSEIGYKEPFYITRESCI